MMKKFKMIKTTKRTINENLNLVLMKYAEFDTVHNWTVNFIVLN